MTIKEALLQDVFVLCLFFVYNKKLSGVSFRGQNLLKPRPDWSPLGVTKT